MTLLGRGRKPVLVLAAIGWAWVRALAGSRSVAVVVLVSLLASPTLRGERDRAALLTIGNSFAEDAATYLPELAAAGGKTLVLGRANLPGCSLEQHAAALAAHDANPEDPKGHPYSNQAGMPRNVARYSLVDLLREEKWDAISLQQSSIRSFRPETYQPFAAQLLERIRKMAPGARIWLHETWAYREDSERFSKGDGFTQEKMFRGLQSAYRTLAAKERLGVFPVGEAFQMARQSARWSFSQDTRFDPASAPFPSVPHEPASLNVGWHWPRTPAETPRKLEFDANHANIAGKYLAAVVVYLCLFDCDEVPSSFAPKELSEPDARSLRAIAVACVLAQRAKEISQSSGS